MARLGRTRRLVLILAILGVLLLGCSVSVYRYLDSYDFWLPTVDAHALQARAQRDQPVGGGEAETVAFLRSLGFENHHILIESGERTYTIEGWIPQPRCCLQPRQIRAYCKFDDRGGLEVCTISGRGSPLEPRPPGSIVERTPIPAP